MSRHAPVVGIYQIIIDETLVFRQSCIDDLWMPRWNLNASAQRDSLGRQFKFADALVQAGRNKAMVWALPKPTNLCMSRPAKPVETYRKIECVGSAGRGDTKRRKDRQDTRANIRRGGEDCVKTRQ